MPNVNQRFGGAEAAVPGCYFDPPARVAAVPVEVGSAETPEGVLVVEAAAGGVAGTVVVLERKGVAAVAGTVVIVATAVGTVG